MQLQILLYALCIETWKFFVTQKSSNFEPNVKQMFCTDTWFECFV